MCTSERKFGARELLGQFPECGGGGRVLGPPAAPDRLGSADLAESGADERVARQVLRRRVQRLPGAEIGVGGDHPGGGRHQRVAQFAAGGPLQVGVRVAGMGRQCAQRRTDRIEAPLQLTGEQQVGELRLAVGQPGRVSPVSSSSGRRS